MFFFSIKSFFTNLFLHSVHIGYFNCLARALQYQQKHWKPMQKLLLSIYIRVKHNRMTRILNNHQVAAWPHTSRCSAPLHREISVDFTQKVDLKIVFGNWRNIFLLKRVRILLVLVIFYILFILYKLYSIFWHVGELKQFNQKSNARSHYRLKVCGTLKNTFWGCLCTFILGYW